MAAGTVGLVHRPRGVRLLSCKPTSPVAPRNACSESHRSPQGMPRQDIGRVQSYASVFPS